MKTHATTKSRATAKSRVAAKTPIAAKTRVTATEAARKFSEILNRVVYKGESFIVERSGRPVCEIRPADEGGVSTEELVEILRSGPHPDKGYLDVLEKITRNQPAVAPLSWER